MIFFNFHLKIIEKLGRTLTGSWFSKLGSSFLEIRLTSANFKFCKKASFSNISKFQVPIYKHQRTLLNFCFVEMFLNVPASLGSNFKSSLSLSASISSEKLDRFINDRFLWIDWMISIFYNACSIRIMETCTICFHAMYNFLL